MDKINRFRHHDLPKEYLFTVYHDVVLKIGLQSQSGQPCPSRLKESLLPLGVDVS